MRTVSTGNVRIITKDCRIGTAKRAEYYDAEQRVVLIGNARVWQDDNVVTGERITIYLAEDRSVVEGGKQERVKAVFYPQDRTAGSDEPAGAADARRMCARADMEGLVAQGLRKWFRSRMVVTASSLDIHRGEVGGPARAQRRGQDHVVLHDRRPPAGRRRAASSSRAQEITQLPMYKRCRLGMGYLPQESSVFRKLTVEENLLAILETLDLSHDERTSARSRSCSRSSI